MPQILFALLLTMAAGPVDINAPENGCWLYGRWLHVAVHAPPPLSTASKPQKHPREKHILLFQPDGQMHRYSPKKGWDRLMMDFNVQEDNVHLSSNASAPVSLSAEKTPEGLLKVCVPQRGDFYYTKIAPKTPLNKIDFSQPLFEESLPGPGE